MSDKGDSGLSRREFVQAAASGAMLAATPAVLRAAAAGDADKSAVLAQIPKMHAANLKRLQDWIALPSIAAENRNYPRGTRAHGAAGARCGLRRRGNHPDLGQAWRVRQDRCRCAHHDRHLLHVRREAVRAGGMELAAARSASGEEGGTRHRVHGTRRGEPEGPGEFLPERADGVQGRRQEAAGEPRAGVRGRGGDRLAALPGGDQQPESAGAS